MLGSTAKKGNTLQELMLWHNKLLKETRKGVLDVVLVFQRVKDDLRADRDCSALKKLLSWR
jgi:hypothetical protein